MPTKQASSAGSRRASPISREHTAVRKRRSAATGETDEQYALISALYHALQGAETCGFYIEDARRAGDEQLVAFFEETRAEHAERAARAKELLAMRLEGKPPDSDEEEDEGEDEEDDEDGEEDLDD